MKQRIIFLFTFLFVLSCCGTSSGRGGQVDARLKAGFIYNFFNYVQWPGAAKGTFVVGLVGPISQGAVIKAMVDGKRVRAAQILSVISLSGVADLTRMDLIFVAATSPDKEKEIITAASNLPILLVGESKSFVEQGGHLAIVRQGNKMSLLVNLRQAKSQGFVVSSKLLRLASYIIQGPSGGVL